MTSSTFGRVAGGVILFVVVAISILSLSPVHALTQQLSVELTVPQTRLVATGYASPFALIRLYQTNNGAIASTTADVQGVFSMSVVRPPGLSSVELEQTDSQGVVSSRLKRVVSIQPQTDRSESFFLAPTITMPTNDQVQSGSIIQLRGQSIPGSKVVLFIDGSQTSESTAVDYQGEFELLIDSSNISVGTHSLSVQATSTFGDSALSHQLLTTIFPLAEPTSPDIVVVAPNVIKPPIVNSPISGTKIVGNTVEIKGSSEPSAQITMYVNNRAASSVFADQNGQWLLNFVSQDPKVTLTFEACIKDRCSILSDPLLLEFLHTFNECDVRLELEQYRFRLTPDSKSVRLAGLDPLPSGELEINWGNGVVEKFTHIKASTSPEFLYQYPTAGQYNGSVTYRYDSCSVVQYFSVDGSSIAAAQDLFYIQNMIVLLTSVGLLSFIVIRKVK